jgi:lipid-A-disaccharide synthase
VRNYGKFRKLFHELLDLALARRPDAIVCVDFSGFNRRFVHAIRERAGGDGWKPKLIQYVSPQVWASRPGRARQLERDLDLLLSIFPFEKAWYAERTPRLLVEFVGHPLCERFPNPSASSRPSGAKPRVLLLPGSRTAELRRHLPVMLAAARQIAEESGASFEMVLPNEPVAALGRELTVGTIPVETRTGGLAEALGRADAAIASTGTVTMECACFGVPTVTLYITSWLTYEIGRRLVTVSSLTMPNLLAGGTVFPEFIQHKATPENLARATLELLNDTTRRSAIKQKLEKIIATLGGPGAGQRAARAVLALFK